MAANGFDDDQTRSFTNLAAGTIVSHYKIISKIGAGGMGEVYLAEDAQLDRKVALKFLPSHLSQDETARARFTREAKAAAKLDHPNIVQVFEVGEFQGRPFFAMAHIEGKSLREVIKEGKLAINDAIEFTRQICEGLHKAHESGVVHRDIKPGNIIIDRDNKARILDFGLATVVGEDKLTKTGSTLGTVGYMSPEQIVGKQVDHRSDLFSVGVILYEMLTGRRPFEGDNDAAVARSITDTTPEPLARYKSGTTGELQRIVDKALMKDPSLRYQHADGMLADLRRLSSKSKVETQKKLFPILLSTLIVVLIVAALTWKPWRPSISTTDDAIATPALLAIMYFENMADPSDSLHLGRIITNLLITDLSESEHLQVVSSQHLYDLSKGLEDNGHTIIGRESSTKIATKAKARWMMAGNVFKNESNLIITSEILDVSSGNVVATQKVMSEPNEGIFAAIDALTREVKKDLLSEEALGEPDPDIADITTNSHVAYRHYIEGLRNHANFEWDKAKESFNKALEYDSTFAMAYYWASWIWGGEDRGRLINKAVKYSDKASKKERLYIKGREAEYNSDFVLYLELLETIVDQYPDEKEAYLWIGYLYHARFLKPEKAIPAYLSALDVDPQFTRAYNRLASAYCAVGDYENAIIAINSYIELTDSSSNSFDSKAYVYLATGEVNKAIDWFQRAIDKDPDFVYSLKELGAIHVIQGNYSLAKSNFEKLVLHRGTWPRTIGRRLLSLIPIHQGRLSEALESLDNGIVADRMEPLNSDTHMKYIWKAEILREMGQFDAALRELDNACDVLRKLYPNQTSFYTTDRIEIHIDKLEFDSAMILVQGFDKEEMKNVPQMAKAYWYSKAYLESSRGNTEKAIEYAEKAKLGKIFTLAEFCRYHMLIGQVYMQSERWRDAIREFVTIADNYSKSRWTHPIITVKIHYFLAQAYEGAGRTEEAIEQYETFLDIWKNADEGLKSVEDADTRLARLKESF